MARSRGWSLAALALVLSFAVAGCSTVRPRIPYTDTAKPNCGAADWKTVDSSLQCAAAVRNHMDSYASQQASVPRAIGLALIPLAAAAAGLAITGTTGTPITALALTGATASGVGFLLSNPARRHAYSVGARAIQCVITTTRPLRFRDRAAFDTFEAAVGAVDEKTRAVSRAIGGVNAAMAAEPPPAGVRADIESQIADAQAVLVAAKALRDKGDLLLKRLDGAAEEVHARVDQIIGLVNDEIDKGEPTMDSVQQALARHQTALTSAASSLGAIAKASEKTAGARGPAKGSGPGTDAAVDRLTEAVRNLGATAAEVASGLRAIGEVAPSQGCLDTAQTTIGAPLQITRSDDEALAPGQSTAFLVTGGVGNVHVSAADAEARAALEISESGQSGAKQVSVRVKPDAKPGTYYIEVTDGVSTKAVRITVKSAPARLAISGAENDIKDAPKPGTPAPPLSYTAIGGSGICSATLTPATGFKPPTTTVSGNTCTVVLEWQPPTATAYTLSVSFGDAKGRRQFRVRAPAP